MERFGKCPSFRVAEIVSPASNVDDRGVAGLSVSVGSQDGFNASESVLLKELKSNVGDGLVACGE